MRLYAIYTTSNFLGGGSNVGIPLTQEPVRGYMQCMSIFLGMRLYAIYTTSIFLVMRAYAIYTMSTTWIMYVGYMQYMHHLLIMWVTCNICIISYLAIALA